MEHQIFYLELSPEPIRFNSVSQLTNVFFDDSNRQVFAVRSGGTTGIVVKGPTDSETISFCMDDKGPIHSIKFSPDNKILAVQRTEATVEFINFKNMQPCTNEVLIHKGKNSLIYGFVWVHSRDVALISDGGIDMYTVNLEKRELKLVKSLNLTNNWFSWCSTANLAVLASNNGVILTPILLKQKTITKLPKLEWENERGIPERDVTLCQIYGTSAILILRPTQSRLLEVVIYLLNGPGLAPKKSHILRLGHNGRFAMNIVDDLVVVHHQATGTSLLFDIALTDEIDSDGIRCHSPITAGKPLKPFSLTLPSISLDKQTMDCELYSPNWVLFQPDIVIDAKLGCLWYVKLKLDSLCQLITDRVRLVDFLLQRTNGKPVLIQFLKDLLSPKQYNGTLLPILENIFNKINNVYKNSIDIELQNQMGQPYFVKLTPKSPQQNQHHDQQSHPSTHNNAISLCSTINPRVIIEQNDMYSNVFLHIADTEYIGKILLLYVHSLAKYNITVQHDISKLIIIDLVKNNQLNLLQRLINYSLISESKPLACFLLSLSNVDTSITQMALDMFYKLNAESIIVEVLLGQGKVIDALRLAKTLPGIEKLSARKYLEAAVKTKDSVIFYTIYKYFQQRNVQMRGSAEFLNTAFCDEYIRHYDELFGKT